MRVTAWLIGVAGLLVTGLALAVEEFQPGTVPMKAEQIAPHTWVVQGQTGWSRTRTKASTRMPVSSSPRRASSSSMRSARQRSASASPD
jgi:hypothetical protein